MGCRLGQAPPRKRSFCGVGCAAQHKEKNRDKIAVRRPTAYHRMRKLSIVVFACYAISASAAPFQQLFIQKIKRAAAYSNHAIFQQREKLLQLRWVDNSFHKFTKAQAAFLKKIATQYNLNHPNWRQVNTWRQFGWLRYIDHHIANTSLFLRVRQLPRCRLWSANVFY